MGKRIIMSIGGSILSTSEQNIFDFKKATELKAFLTEWTHLGYQFVLCVGGGFLARKFQTLLKTQGYPDLDQHNIGVATINVNAVMLKAVMGDLAEDEILRYQDFDKDLPISFSKPLLISAAGAPGHSSDWNTVKLAIRCKVDYIFNLTNIDGVYTADPRKDPKATRLTQVTWDKYLDIIGNPTEHKPGANYPVDPLAARLAKEDNISMCILSSEDFGNVRKALDGEDFIGTTIS